MLAPTLRAEALDLRVRKRLSLNEIAARTGIAKGTLSVWLRSYPLSAEERCAKARAAIGDGQLKKARGEASRLHALAGGGARLSRHQKSKAAEAAVLLRLVLFDLTPFASMFDGEKADWIVETRQGKTWKIQVKWARAGRDGLPRIPLRCRGGGGNHRRYLEGEFDFIVAYDLWSDTCYVWSFDEVRGKHSATIAPESAERWDKLLLP